ncbi:hypothetical protein [Microbulbifer celer]|uniref:Esterase n=1 Tax=Microbulbifer celer TaxID=435905 RepID=A0ABW3U4U9_9GAMM|nr:hypothetical protein [Microbulbifer celer]UFN57870.1 hypothetical protein LPW13_02155 [Microbulbifer celer]
MSFPGEKVFQLTRPVKYVFQESNENSSFLVVVFSAFHGKESEGKPPTYNYINTLGGCKHNKIFILDDCEGSVCYYTGKNRDFSLESSVVALIVSIANERGIPMENVILCGSSKGGYAALYYGIKYSFGAVISGGPQTFMGNYLSSVSSFTRALIEFIAGDSGEESVEYLNRLIFDQIENKISFPEIYIHVGRGDHHYEGHVKPLMHALDAQGASYELDLAEYDDHGALANYFQGFLLGTLEQVVRSRSV